MARRALDATADLARAVLDSVLPQLCPGCSARAEPSYLLCEACLEMIPRLSTPLCARCLALGADPSGCRTHPGRTVWAAWVYDERAGLVVHALKYGERPALARSLGEELARVTPLRPRPDLVLEVPLHPVRHRERGYNQAALLADALGRTISTPRLEGALERVRPTRPQARLDPAERRKNVAGAFRLRRPQWMKGRNVVIVDDVMTTGATLDACLEALERAGANASGVALAWAQ